MAASSCKIVSNIVVWYTVRFRHSILLADYPIVMKRFSVFFVFLLGGFLMMGANGCSSDPNIEGAKLDLRNQDYDRALENVNAAIERDPQNAEAYDLKGQILQEQAGDENDPEAHRQIVEEMMQAYNRAVELDAELEEDVQQRLRLAYYNEFRSGIQAFNRGQEDAEAYNEAVAYFDLAGQIQPDSASAYVNKAYALLNAGRQQEAVEPLELALEHGDTQVETYMFLADLYNQQGETEQSMQILEQASDTHPNDSDIQSQLLNAYVQAGRIDEAMEQYRAAVQREPDNKLYRYNLGSLLLEAEEYDEAIEHLQRAVDVDPEYANAQYNLGASYVNKAVELNEEISDLDDQLREERAQLSDAQIDEREAEIEELAEERRELFAQAVPPLERAKSLMEASGDDPSSVCQALFSAYVQTDKQQEAQSIAECAGYEDLN